ncbi:hypothetical protein NUBL21976_43280 [Klebsiella pneumoniae]|mgnify:CR=1 FL=1|nr:hypothetical protein NUBL21976_43280 [Klebsiella pneumoniae]DAH61698.1 MAG TPA: hypothetical protein [Caudoviricetes sp.]
MKKITVRSDKSLMVSINNEEVSLLEKFKHCKKYHFKESEGAPTRLITPVVLQGLSLNVTQTG